MSTRSKSAQRLRAEKPPHPPTMEGSLSQFSLLWQNMTGKLIHNKILFINFFHLVSSSLFFFFSQQKFVTVLEAGNLRTQSREFSI